MRRQLIYPSDIVLVNTTYLQNLKLIIHAVSLGGTESLIEHPLSMSHGKQLLRDLNSPTVAPGLLRFR